MAVTDSSLTWDIGAAAAAGVRRARTARGFGASAPVPAAFVERRVGVHPSLGLLLRSLMVLLNCVPAACGSLCSGHLIVARRWIPCRWSDNAGKRRSLRERPSGAGCRLRAASLAGEPARRRRG